MKGYIETIPREIWIPLVLTKIAYNFKLFVCLRRCPDCKKFYMLTDGAGYFYCSKCGKEIFDKKVKNIKIKFDKMRKM